MNLLEELKNRFRPALATLTDAPESFVEMVRPSGDVRHGDYQANCAMPLGGQLKQPPRHLPKNSPSLRQKWKANRPCPKAKSQANGTVARPVANP